MRFFRNLFTSEKPELPEAELPEEVSTNQFASKKHDKIYTQEDINFANDEIKKYRKIRITEKNPIKFLDNEYKFYYDYLKSRGTKKKLEFKDWYKVYKYEEELREKYNNYSNKLLERGENPLSYNEWYSDVSIPPDPELEKKYKKEEYDYEYLNTYGESPHFTDFDKWKQDYINEKIDEKHKITHSTPKNFDISFFADGGKRKTKRRIRKTRKTRKGYKTRKIQTKYRAINF